MRIHYIMHVPFEDPAAICDWAKDKGAKETYSKLYESDQFPQMDDFDLLIIMGGPMGVHDESQYPWLKNEKAFLKRAIDEGKPCLGICLGAQLLANCLGANVKKNLYKEIGFFPVSLTPLGWNSPIFGKMPATFNALHWHGDTFDIPKGALHIASSSGCANQAFIYDNRIIGFQFHIESTRKSLENLIKNSGNELLEEGEYIQKPDYLLDEKHDFTEMNKVLFTFLDNFTEYLEKEKIF